MKPALMEESEENILHKKEDTKKLFQLLYQEHY